MMKSCLKKSDSDRVFKTFGLEQLKGDIYMPDLERLTDKLMIDLAASSEQVSYAKGYVEGKTHARKEIAIITAFVPGVVLVVLAIIAAQRIFNL